MSPYVLIRMGRVVSVLSCSCLHCTMMRLYLGSLIKFVIIEMRVEQSLTFTGKTSVQITEILSSHTVLGPCCSHMSRLFQKHVSPFHTVSNVASIYYCTLNTLGSIMFTVGKLLLCNDVILRRMLVLFPLEQSVTFKPNTCGFFGFFFPGNFICTAAI